MRNGTKVIINRVGINRSETGMIAILIAYIVINTWGFLGYLFFIDTMCDRIDYSMPLRLSDVGYYFVCGPWIWAAMLIDAYFSIIDRINPS